MKKSLCNTIIGFNRVSNKCFAGLICSCLLLCLIINMVITVTKVQYDKVFLVTVIFLGGFFDE